MNSELVNLGMQKDCTECKSLSLYFGPCDSICDLQEVVKHSELAILHQLKDDHVGGDGDIHGGVIGQD